MDWLVDANMTLTRRSVCVCGRLLLSLYRWNLPRLKNNPPHVFWRNLMVLFRAINFIYCLVVEIKFKQIPEPRNKRKVSLEINQHLVRGKDKKDNFFYLSKNFCTKKIILLQIWFFPNLDFDYNFRPNRKLWQFFGPSYKKVCPQLLWRSNQDFFGLACTLVAPEWI